MQTSAPRKKVSDDDRLDRVFHALADRTRRAMLARLAQGPAIVRELAEPFNMSVPAVSKHLRVLESANLVARTVDGRVHRCALTAGPMKGAEEWLDHYRSFWENTLSALASYVEQDAENTTIDAQEKPCPARKSRPPRRKA